MKGRAILVCIVAVGAIAGPVQAREWGSPNGLAISADGRFVYATGETTLTYARDSEGRLALTDNRGPSGRSIALSPDGRNAYLGRDDGNLVVLSRDPGSGDIVFESLYETGFKDIHSLVASPDGRHVYLSSLKASAIAVLARDPASGSVRRVGAVFGGPGDDIGWLDNPRQIVISPDGRHLYVSDDGVGAFRRDASSGALTPIGDAAAGSSGTTYALAISPDGRRVYSGVGGLDAFSRDPSTGVLTVLDERYRAPCRGIFTCFEVLAAAVSPDSSLIASGQLNEDSLWLTRPTANGVAHVGTYREGPGGIRGVTGLAGAAWSPDGRYLHTVAGVPSSCACSPPSGAGTLSTWRRDGSALTQVAAFRQPMPDPDEPAAITINDGALFTNSRNVTVTARPQYGAAGLKLDNDSGFEGVPARRFALDDRYRWRLVDIGLGRGVRRVFAEIRWGSSNRPDDVLVLADDIVLDTRDPLIRSARLTRAKRKRGRASSAKRARSSLTLRAKDNRSGIKRVQVTTRRKRPGRKLRFKRKLSIRGNPRKVWVRVFDGAGNASRWRVVRRRG